METKSNKKNDEALVDDVEKTVAVPKEEWEEMRKQLKRLEEAANKARLAHVDERAGLGKKLIKQVKLTRMSPTGPVVIKWELVVNESYVSNGRIYEKQVVDVHFEDGHKEQMELVDFYRKQNKELVAEIKKTLLDEETSEQTLLLILPNGKELEIGIAYVN